MKPETSKRSRSSKSARRSHSVNDELDGSDSSKTIMEVSDSSSHSPEKKPKFVLEEVNKRNNWLADVGPYDPSVPMAVAKAKAVAKARRDGTLAPGDSGLAYVLGQAKAVAKARRDGMLAPEDAEEIMQKVCKEHGAQMASCRMHNKVDGIMQGITQRVLAPQGRWHHAERLQRTRVTMDSDGEPPLLEPTSSDGKPETHEPPLLEAGEEQAREGEEEETQHQLADVAPYDPRVPMAVMKAKVVASPPAKTEECIEAKATAQDASCQQEASQSPLEESYVPNDSQNPFPENCDTLEVDWE